jgi:hypothetical protein
VIAQWAKDRSIDVVLWTDLPGSFDGIAKHDFLNAAVNHVQQLPPEGKAMAAEYVWRAPDLVVTPLRSALQSEPWFKRAANDQVNLVGPEDPARSEASSG